MPGSEDSKESLDEYVERMNQLIDGGKDSSPYFVYKGPSQALEMLSKTELDLI